MHVVIVTVAGVEGLSLNLISVLQAAVDRISDRVGGHLPKSLLGISLGGIPALKFAVASSAFSVNV
jgi:hypothetical protein